MSAFAQSAEGVDLACLLVEKCGMSPQASFESGEWYLLITCEHCGAKHILPDPSSGQTIPMESSSCSNCLRITKHTDDNIERYKHEGVTE